MATENGSEVAAASTPQTLEASGEARVQYQGEKVFKGDYLIAPEQENIALRAKITRYSELVATSVAGFAFCAFVDALREPSDYRGWIIVAILLAVIVGGNIVRKNTTSTTKLTRDASE